MNRLYYGDNLDVLREHFRDESADLIYLDPPFNSDASYNILYREPTGEQSKAQVEAFVDTWHWNDSAEQSFDEVIRSSTDAAELMRAIRAVLRESDLMAYLTMMAVRLIELHRVLKPTGSLYLHCDPTASHYLKIVLDGIFGAENFINELSWLRSQTRSSLSRSYRRAHDVILFYSKSDNYKFNIQYRELSAASLELYSNTDEKGVYQSVPLLVSGKRNGIAGKPWKGIDPNTRGKLGMHWVTVHEKLDEYDKKGLIVWPQKEGGAPRLKYYLEDNAGVPVNDFWDDVPFISSSSKESLGYPTQKSLELLTRVIQASSNEGDVVLDPFCGCGTTVHAAEKLRRQWTGIDITHLAISLIEKRLRDAFPGISFDVHGTPKDPEGARELAARNKYQFQWWAVSLVNAVPFGGQKKGADGGIDGHIYFKPDGKTTEKAIVSVKGGDNVNVAMVRDLAHVVDREKAKIGVFITLAEPTGPMKTEAIKTGYYETEFGKYPKLQILTIKELFEGKKPAIPLVDPTAFKQAKAEPRGKQERLL